MVLLAFEAVEAAGVAGHVVAVAALVGVEVRVEAAVAAGIFWGRLGTDPVVSAVFVRREAPRGVLEDPAALGDVELAALGRFLGANGVVGGVCEVLVIEEFAVAEAALGVLVLPPRRGASVAELELADAGDVIAARCELDEMPAAGAALPVARFGERHDRVVERGARAARMRVGLAPDAERRRARGAAKLAGRVGDFDKVEVDERRARRLRAVHLVRRDGLRVHAPEALEERAAEEDIREIGVDGDAAAPRWHEGDVARRGDEEFLEAAGAELRATRELVAPRRLHARFARHAPYTRHAASPHALHALQSTCPRAPRRFGRYLLLERCVVLVGRRERLGLLDTGAGGLRDDDYNVVIIAG